MFFTGECRRESLREKGLFCAGTFLSFIYIKKVLTAEHLFIIYIYYSGIIPIQ